MSNFYWLEPGWKDACCAKCGINIAEDGGDPDAGVCFGCFQRQKEEYEEYYATHPDNPANQMKEGQ